MLLAKRFAPMSTKLVTNKLFEFTLALLLMLPLLCIVFPTVRSTVMFAFDVMLKLFASMLPVTFKLVPVAAPMLGVVNCALAITTMFPPTIPVVTPSVFADIVVPVMLIPEPAEYDPAALNCVKVKLSVPIITSPTGAVIT